MTNVGQNCSGRTTVYKRGRLPLETDRIKRAGWEKHGRGQKQGEKPVKTKSSRVCTRCRSTSLSEGGHTLWTPYTRWRGQRTSASLPEHNEDITIQLERHTNTWQDVNRAHRNTYDTYTHPNTRTPARKIVPKNVCRDRLLWFNEKEDWVTSEHRNRCKTPSFLRYY